MTTPIDTNAFLGSSDRATNAQFIMDWFTANTNWTKNAIAGMLGNIESESTMNFGIYEGLDSSSSTNGFGLTQWTPNTKYFNWAASNGFSGDHINGELNRIVYEAANNIQWFRNPYWTGTDWTFAQFTQSTDTPENLAKVWVYWYEHPANVASKVAGRQSQARHWFDTLTGTGGTGTGTQLAQFPMDVINISQGENGSTSHKGTLCIDFVGNTAHYPYYAPCDCECLRRDDTNAFLIWKSSSPVMCADGQVRSITWSCFHDNSPLYNVGDKITKGTIMGHSGTGGDATGDHFHLNVIEGSSYTGFQYEPDPALAGTELHIFDVFAVNGVDIVNGLGYDWKTSTYADGSGVGGTTTANDNIDLINLMLADTLNGWKW